MKAQNHNELRGWARLSKYRLLALAAIGVFAASAANASDITWTLDHVTFDDGATASGTFIFNASTDTYVSWDITTTATVNGNFCGCNLHTEVYTTNSETQANTSYYLNPHGLEVDMSAGFDRLGLNFASPLTNAGGMIAVTGSEVQNDGFQSRAISGGFVTATPVPLPGGGLMFLGGIGVLGALGWRRRQPTA